MISRFYTTLLLITAFFYKSNYSMLSLKDRYLLKPDRKIKPSEVLPDQLDKDLWENLVREVPELKTYLIRDKSIGKGLPFNKEIFFTTSTEEITADLEADYESSWWKEDTDVLSEPTDFDLIFDTTTENSTTITNRVPFATRWPQINQTHRVPVRRNSDQYFLRKRDTISCYQCGLYESKIPKSPLCNDAFLRSGHFKYRTIRRYFRVKCRRRRFARANGKSVYGTWYQWNRGLRRIRSGPFVGGCFKRYLDVGNIYTSRGCRTDPPYQGWKNFATHRLKRLEMTLRTKANGCIASPSSSLTPFARGISLFARYHVCVCNRNYCNGVGKNDFVFKLLITVVFTLYNNINS